MVALSLMGASTYFVSGGGATAAWAQETVADEGSHGWEEAWRIGLSRGIGTAPVWADSMLLVASLDRNLHAVRPSTPPRVLWDENLRGGLHASPVVVGDRLLLGEAGIEGRLVALDRGTRREIWAVELGDLVSAPLAADGRIYAVTAAGLVVALTPGGSEVWRMELATRVAARPARVGGALVVAAADGVLYALDPETGAVRERLDTGAGPIWGDPALLGDGQAVYATLEGQLLAVTEDLEIVARRSFPSRFFAGPVVEGRSLILVGHEGSVWSYAWDAAEIRWRQDLPAAVRAAPAVGPRSVAIGDLGGTLYQLDRETGELLWRARLDGAVTAAPLAHGALVYVATEEGTLYAFRPTTPPSR
jgi:eukaryotic-like serine/threonine-protein kinase